MNKMRQHAPYLAGPLVNLKGIIDSTKKALRQVNFEGFVGTGLSGTMVVPALAYVMEKRFAIVRKPDDRGHHSSGTVESGLRHDDRWIFIDDFISSGATLARVISCMTSHSCDATYIGRYLYNDVLHCYFPQSAAEVPWTPEV